VKKSYGGIVDNMVNNMSITRTDVLKEISKLKPHKFPGLDEIYPKVLKEYKEELSYLLTTLFNSSL